MKLIVKNLDEGRVVRVLTRSTRSGSDGPALLVNPGQAVEMEITDEDHLVAIPADFLEAAEQAVALAVLVDASDEQITGIMAAMLSEGVNLTKAGGPELPALNERLADAGYSPIKATKRDALHGALTA